MKKIISVCKRVEGHGSVDIILKNDQISNIEFNLSIFRGFENILKKKELFDIPKIASRICGLCHASQTIASCKAIESLYNLKPKKQTTLLRRILMTGELIKSHSMHLFLQSLPDLLYLFKYEPNILSPYDLIQFDYELTNRFYELIKMGNEIDRLFGGRSIHAITPFPGGNVYKYSQKDLNMAKKLIKKTLENIDYILNRYIELFAKLSPPEIFKLPNPTYLSLQNNEQYDRYTGIIRMNAKNNEQKNFFPDHYMKYFDKDPELRGIEFPKKELVLVGPLARYHNIQKYSSDEIQSKIKTFDESWKDNILFSNILKLIEIYTEAEKCLTLLKEPILTENESLNSDFAIQNDNGIGIVEAPRGTLMHHYHLDGDQNVDEIKLFIATEINIPIINRMLAGFSKDFYKKTGDMELVKKKAQMIIRAFDPCISCATH
ncbi:MAG: hypothetical protein EU541_01185 [Promethearchaeota archaeon]|nr:MAG: hypothetical protein EU541_01185 [Candidatus Lokiarchaeota archaeon]